MPAADPVPNRGGRQVRRARTRGPAVSRPAIIHWSEDERAAVVELGREALGGAEPAALIERALQELVNTLGADFAAVERLLPDGSGLVVEAALGWEPGAVGTTSDCGPGTLGRALLDAPGPELVDNLAADPRVGSPPGIWQGAQSLVGAPIGGEEAPYGVLTAGARRLSAFMQADANFVRAIADVLADAIKRKHAEAVLRTAHDHERHLRERLETHARLVVEAQEAERRRLARELHDEIGQTLTGLKLTLEGLERRPPEEIADGLNRALALVAEIMSRVDILSLDLRPAMLDDLGLLPALLWLVGRYYAQTGVRVSVEHSGLDRALGPEVETAAYRIVQEALTNVARHAETGRATVRCTAAGDMFFIEVRDEGAGFDAAAAGPGSLKFGLVGMEERARLVGGELTVTSEPGKGTSVVASLPIDASRQAPGQG